jgi:hypothetical protein
MDRSVLSTMSAVDAVVALRSLSRRFREAFRPSELTGEMGAADVTQAPPSGGRAPLELVLAAAKSLETLQAAIEATLTRDEPELDPVLLDRDRRDAVSPQGSVADALARLARVAEQFAARVEHVSARDWTRRARVGGATVTALELLQEAVASARTYLDELQKSLEELRRART